MAAATCLVPSARRQALLAALVKKASISRAGESIRPRSGDRRRAPLSCGQRQLWVLDRLAPGNPVYNVPSCFRLRGALDISIFTRALREVGRHHETLRTTFGVENFDPVQIISPDFDLEPSVVDLQALPQPKREQEALRLAVEAARCPFDLERGPLVHVTMFRLSERDHVVLIAMHHIICDGWSMGVLFRELAAVYEAFSQGLHAQLPELAIQYSDYAVWQREHLASGKLESQIAFWKKHLTDAPAALDLPSDRPRPPKPTLHGAVCRRALSPGLLQPLRQLATAENATLFMSFLAAFSVLLHRYSRQEDIVVGSPIANRDRAELEPLIGFLPNTLPLRLDLSGDPSFLELLRRVRDTSVSAYSNGAAPFEKIVEELTPLRSATQTPLFQAAFLMQDSALPARCSSFEVTPIDLDLGTAKCDITLSVSAGPGTLSTSFEYSTDLFDADTISRMSGHLETLIESIVIDPERRLSELLLLTPVEERRLVIDWNRSDKPFSDGSCAHELFEQQAARIPDAPALILGGNTVSYAELNRRANRVAHALRRLGVGPEVLTAIALERSPEMIVAILGVLKAGGAYLPLALDHPSDRISFLLEDARPRVVVSKSQHRSQLAKCAGAGKWFDIDDPIIEIESAENLSRAAGPSNLAYVIYTSGSTGRPKGVMIEHRGLCNLAAAQQELFELGPGRRVLQFAAPTFDASVWEIFMALASGASLCLGEGSPFQPEELARVLRVQKVTTATLPPSVLSVLSPGDFPDLHTVISAGESCTEETVRRWSAGRRFFNAYGPTETTVCATAKACEEADRGVSIGRPISNTQVYILDGNMRPTPIGVPGELHIGGAGVARGYLNRPELSASRFVPNPFEEDGRSRLYKTGDLARYLRDGEIEFLGRIDDQVKIRGFRIELGEIESRLAEHPGILHCAVVAREDAPGNPRLVGYVVPRNEVPAEAALRTFLGALLPAYMVPSSFVFLTAMPLNSSGKVDRRALPPPEAGKPRDRVAPRDALEKRLAGIWENVLGISQVGVTDNFFELGGNSLVAANLMARIREMVTCELPLALLFENGSIEAVAAALRAAERSGPGVSDASCLVPLRKSGSEPPLFLVHPAGGNVLCYLELARLLGPNQPVYGIEAPAEAQPPETIEAFAERYVAELRKSVFSGPYRLGGWSSGGVIAFEMAQQLKRQGEIVDLVVLLDSWARPLGPEPDDGEILAEIAAMQARLRGAALIPPEISEHETRRLLEQFRAGIRAVRSYIPKRSTVRTVLFRAGESDGTQDRGWAKACGGMLDILATPGGHTNLLAEPHVQVLAESLDEVLRAGRRSVFGLHIVPPVIQKQIEVNQCM